MFAKLSSQTKQYALITANYWAFTLTDGALRMLIVLYFYQLGYSPFSIAMLFLFYEFFGIITNLVGGWLGTRLGLNKIMNIGLALQILALLMLAVPAEMLSIAYVMSAQALSGIAKDLNKMSAKSSIKLLVAHDAQDKLYRWVALLTGSKNTLKGVGFFMGGVLLTLLGFKMAVFSMAVMLFFVWVFSLCALKKDLGKSKYKAKFSEIFSKSKAINLLSAARLFLFGARDVWFVVALPVYLASSLGWSGSYVAGFMALWVIGYGLVQSMAPLITGSKQGKTPSAKSAMNWAAYLAGIPLSIAIALHFDFYPQAAVVLGLLVFGVVFAINSSLHSYLIVSFAKHDGVSMDVGFYYMANAAGRLLGTLLSGLLYQQYGLVMCLWISSLFIAIAGIASWSLHLSTKAQ